MTFKAGDVVQHKALGIGLVKWVSAEGKHEVDFEQKGLVKIAADYVHLLTLVDPETTTRSKNKLLPGMR